MAEDTRRGQAPLALLIPGMVFAVPVLLFGFGGGFLLALAVIALLPVLAGVTITKYTIDLARTPQVSALRNALSMEGHIRLTRAALAAGSIVAIFAVAMTVLHGIQHTVADFEAYWTYLALVAIGAGVLAGLSAEPMRRAEVALASVSAIGLLAAFAALMSCCLWELGSVLPTAAPIALKLVTNMIPILGGGIGIAAIGLVTLMMLVEAHGPLTVPARA